MTVKIVVEPIFDPGTDRTQRLGKQLLYRHRHHMGGGVSNFFEGFRFAGFG